MMYKIYQFQISQKGVALITVLLVVAIVTVLVVSMSSSQYYSIKRQENAQAHTQAWKYVFALEQWAMLVLNEDLAENKVDSSHDKWYQGIEETKVYYGKIASKITDLQGRFNINNLVIGNEIAENEYKLFVRLLEKLEIEPEIADAIIDWIDEDSDVRYPGGAEDSYYSLQPVPTRVANHHIVQISELLAIKGVDQKVYNKLRPYITALPKQTKLNVNTLSEIMLISLVDNLSESELKSLLLAREDSAINNINEWLKRPEFSDKEIDKNIIGISSNYYGMYHQVQVGKQKLEVFSKLHRNNKGTKILNRHRRGI